MARIKGKKPSKTRRLLGIARIVAAYGFDLLRENPPIWGRLVSKHKHHREKTGPERFRLLLEELGPTYIKLGQAASTRPDFVPESYVEELRKLQDHAPAQSYAEIAGVVRRELGADPDAVFACFNKKPYAAASLSQVHEAYLLDGTHVAVKIQRPDIELRIEEDFLVLRDVARYIAHHFEEAKGQDVEGWFEEFQTSLRNELDFRREGRNIERFEANFRDEDGVFVPAVYWDFSTRRVLTMDWVEGIRVDDSQALDAAGIDKGELACRCAHTILKMVNDDGFFQADPHAGNFFVMDDGRIALLDMGMVGVLDPSLKDAILRISLSVASENAERLLDELVAFADADMLIERRLLKRDIEHVLKQHFWGFEPVSLAKLMSDLMRASAKRGLTLPSSIALLTRSYMIAEGVGRMLDPGFNMNAYSEPYLRGLFAKRYAPEGVRRKVMEQTPIAAELIANMPARTERMLIELEKGQLTFVARVHELDRILHHMHMAAHRISMSMLAAGILGGLAVLAVAYRPDGFHGWPGVLLGVFFVGIVIVVFSFLRTIWRSGHDS